MDSNLVQQQHQQVTKKRSGNEAQNGCVAEKKEKLELGREGNGTTKPKPDSEDGTKITIEELELTGWQVTETDDRRCCIQSILRESRPPRNLRGAEGNLLKAHPGRSSKTMVIDFTGINPKDPATEFIIEQGEYYGSEANVLTHRSGNDNYYLAVRRADPQVILRKSKNFPSKDKYFFHVKAVSDEDDPPNTLQSLKTSEYVRCDENGKVCLAQITETDGHGMPEDRGKWFKTIHYHNTHQQVVQQEMLY